MDNDSLPELLKEHYASTRLPDARVSEILGACAIARSAYAWRRRTFFASGAAAAALLVLLVSLSGVFTSMPSGEIVGGAGASLPGTQVEQVFRDNHLVAAMIHANGCPNSRAIEPVFARLQQEFINERVLFVTFDVSSECAMRQAELLSESLGIQDAFQQHQHTGHILLVRSSGEICDIVDREKPVAAAAASVRHGLVLSGF